MVDGVLPDGVSVVLLGGSNPPSTTGLQFFGLPAEAGTFNFTVQADDEFFAKHGVKSVVASDQNIGCPHEEGPDFPVGEDCPFCPYWKGQQGSNAAF